MRHQIEHHADVLLERFGNADRRVRHRQLGRDLVLGPLDPLLDLADVLEVLVEPDAVARAEPAFELGDVPLHRIEDAAVAAASAARRSSSEPGRPNIRSNTTRGLISIGSGVVGDFHEMVFM